MTPRHASFRRCRRKIQLLLCNGGHLATVNDQVLVKWLGQDPLELGGWPESRNGPKGDKLRYQVLELLAYDGQLICPHLIECHSQALNTYRQRPGTNHAGYV